MNPFVAAKVLARSGAVRPYRPSRMLGVARTLLVWGAGTAGGTTTLADRFPDEVGLVDDLGELTFGELRARSNALAQGLADLGVEAGESVAVLCRNHRYFIEASIAVAKLGADVVYLNTSFSAPQIADVVRSERVTAIVLDEEFADALADSADGRAASVRSARRTRVLGWTDSPAPGAAERAAGSGPPTCEALIAAYGTQDLAWPDQRSRTTILTSGTTGKPRGARREHGSIDAAVALLSGLPLRHRWRTHIAAPLFHTWGWAHFQLGMLLGSTMVLTRHFDPVTCLGLVERHRCESLIAIPIMLQRILAEVGPTGTSPTTYDISALRVTAVSGSALTGDLSAEWMDLFGDNLYNVYGSTEVAWVSIASPSDLRLAPGTAGRPPPGTEVRVLDDSGRDAGPGQPGRIYVRNSMLLEGYTGGGSKEMLDGLMATGDRGWLDDQVRLFVAGRDDDMIVSGGENVFPQEVEDCLARHPDVADVAVVGVLDPEFGQRLRAFVVRRAGSTVGEPDLKQHVKARLARFKTPRDVVFVDALPRNATGKVVRRELAVRA
jgi:fatty-acyl-CoA synthase